MNNRQLFPMFNSMFISGFHGELDRDQELWCSTVTIKLGQQGELKALRGVCSQSFCCCLSRTCILHRSILQTVQ